MKRISRALYSLLVWKPDLSSLQRQSHKHVGCHMRSSNHGNWSICFNNGLVGILIWFVSLLCWCIKPGTGWDWLFGFFKSTAGWSADNDQLPQECTATRFSGSGHLNVVGPLDFHLNIFSWLKRFSRQCWVKWRAVQD